MKKILLFILLFTYVCFAQPGAGYKIVRWSDLSKAVKDSIRLGSTSIDTNTIINIVGPYWRSDISDSIAGIGAQSLNYKEWTVVAKSGGKFSTIQAGINNFGTLKADSQAVVEIMPGTYNETITLINYCNLYFHPGAKLKLSTSANNSLVNLLSHDTLTISGGEFERYVPSGYNPSIFNLDSRSKLNLYNANLKLQQVNSANIAYHFTVDSSQIEAYNTELLTIGDHVGGIHLIGNSKMDLSGNYYCGSIVLENSSQLVMDYNYVYTDFDRGIWYIKNTSNLNISVKKQFLKTANGIASESVAWGPTIYIYGKAKMLVHDGIFKSQTYTLDSDSTNIELRNCYNDVGRPYLAAGAAGAKDTTYWKVINCNLKDAPISQSDYALGGIHFFESNPTAGDTDYVDLYVENSTLTFGEPNGLGVGDTAQYVGCIFAIGWRGKVKLINSNFIDYGDDGRTSAYRAMGSITGITKFEAIGCVFEHYSPTKDGWTIVPLTARPPLNILFQDCKFYFHNNTSGYAALNFDNSGTGRRNIFSKDTLNINSTSVFSPKSSVGIYREGIIYVNAFLDSLSVSQGWTTQKSYFTDLEVFNQIRGPGPGSYQNSGTGLTTFSDAFLFYGDDTLATSGKNGDSLKIRLTPINKMQTAVGYWRQNKSDISMTIYVSFWNFGNQVYSGIYDIRLIHRWTSNSSSYGYFFHVDTLCQYGGLAKFIWGGMDSYDGYSYMLPYFYLINKDATAVSIQVWVKQSLNYSKLEFTRF